MGRAKVTRRYFQQMLASLGVVATAVPLAATSSRADPNDHPVFFGWGGYDVPELWPSYQEKYGALPRFTNWGDEEEGLTKIRGGFRPDVVFPCNYKVRKWQESGFIGEIDPSRLKNFPDIFPSLLDIDGSVVDGKRYWVPTDWGQTSIIYRTDLAPEYVHNETWEILWDPKYKNRVAMFDSLVDGVVAAAIVAGVDPWDYTSEDNLAKTRVKLEELARNVRFFSNDATTMAQGLATGELIAATAWNEMIVDLQKQGLPVKWMSPREGAMTFVCGLSIVEGTPFYDKAHEMIDAMLDPRSRAWEIMNFGYGSATKPGYDLVDPDVLKSMGLASNPDEILSAAQFQQAIKGEQRLQMMFEEVKAEL